MNPYDESHVVWSFAKQKNKFCSAKIQSIFVQRRENRRTISRTVDEPEYKYCIGKFYGVQHKTMYEKMEKIMKNADTTRAGTDMAEIGFEIENVKKT